MDGCAPGDGAPVIYEDHPTHQSLVGRIEHIARFGALLTDFNLLTINATDPKSGTAEFKAAAIRIEKLTEARELELVGAGAGIREN